MIFLIKLGTIELISTSGNIIAICEKTPEINIEVFDARGRKIGRITKVFGPVANPYVKILPDKSLRTLESFTWAGKPIYTGEKHGGKKEKSRRRGDKEMPLLREHTHH
ncbi:MAG: H/ACA ribonucleoprotein complex subunit GAR1 [Thermoplasmata archaeon]